jgi:PIN domain nuclease of toxin-antitoxin system
VPSSKAGIDRLRVLLDTQVLLDAYLGEKLPKRVHAVLADPETERLISVASIMEIAIKTGKLEMSAEHVQEAARDLRLTAIPFTPQHAYRLFSLPAHHRDPFGRMIIATALSEHIPLIGADRMFKSYRGLEVIWG